MNLSDINQMQLRTLNDNLFIASHPKKDNYFVIVRHTPTGEYMKFKDTIVARLYQLRNRWYIWYEATSHREVIDSKKPFSFALKKIEEEFK